MPSHQRPCGRRTREPPQVLGSGSGVVLFSPPLEPGTRPHSLWTMHVLPWYWPSQAKAPLTTPLPPPPAYLPAHMLASARGCQDRVLTPHLQPPTNPAQHMCVCVCVCVWVGGCVGYGGSGDIVRMRRCLPRIMGGALQCGPHFARLSASHMLLWRDSFIRLFLVSRTPGPHPRTGPCGWLVGRARVCTYSACLSLPLFRQGR